MNNDKKGKNIFSFNVRILNNNKNYKKIKDIFIRKQDIYLIKLLEKKAKENKNTRLNTSLKKIIFDENKSSLNDVNKMNSIINKTYDINKPQTHEIYKIHLNKKDEMSQTNDIYNNNEINKFEGRSDARKLFDYKNIRIIKKNLDEDLINDINANTNTNNYNYNNNIENTINAQRHNQNTIEEQITSKIYNSDMSRNNKTMLNVQLENIQNNNNFQNNIFNKQHIISERLYDKNNSNRNLLFSKYNKTTFKPLIIKIKILIFSNQKKLLKK
jgi:hypothetical protein